MSGDRRRPTFRDGLARLASIFTTLPDPRALVKSFYHPGEKQQPAKVRYTATAEQVKARKKRHVPRAQRLRTMVAFEITRPSGRQWERLRRKLAREGRKA